MLSLAQVLDERTELGADDRAWLEAFVHEWHLLADVAFSDLILWVPDPDENIYWAADQVRPNTGPTALEDDVVGESVHYDPEHLVTAAFLSGEICETSDNQLRSGIPVDVWAIPIRRHGRVIAVVERHTNQMGVRAPGALEDAYLEVADTLSTMLWRGEFPIDPPSDPRVSPKVGDGLIVCDPSGTVTYATPNAVSTYRKMGLPGDLEGENLGLIAQQLLGAHPQIGQALATDMSGARVREFDIESTTSTIRFRVAPLTSTNARVGTLVLCRDLTEVRRGDRALVTKDATIREIHHRVKNNLQTVAALLRLQSRRVQAPEAKAALQDAMSRVQAIAVVHEILSQAFDESVVFDDVADRILHMVGDVASTDGQVVARREGSFGTIPAAVASPLALVITELCQNAVEHGHDQSSGQVWVRPSQTDGVLVVDVADDGTGLPDDFDMDALTSLGLSIVRTLVGDLGGTFAMGCNADGVGTLARLTLPLTASD